MAVGAEGLEGTVVAAWDRGETDGGSEFHEGLVEGGAGRAEGGGAGPTRWCEWLEGDGFVSGCLLDQLGGERPCGGGWGGEWAAGEPAEDAGDVAVDDGGGEVEGGTGDGAGGVAADAGEGEDVFVTIREPAVVMFEDELCGPVEVFEAAVVAEAGPEFPELVPAGAGEGGDVGEGLDPVLPVGDDGVDAGLLEHDLGDP